MQVLVRESSSFFLCSTAHHDEFVVVAKACTLRQANILLWKKGRCTFAFVLAILCSSPPPVAHSVPCPAVVYKMHISIRQQKG